MGIFSSALATHEHRVKTGPVRAALGISLLFLVFSNTSPLTAAEPNTVGPRTIAASSSTTHNLETVELGGTDFTKEMKAEAERESFKLPETSLTEVSLPLSPIFPTKLSQRILAYLEENDANKQTAPQIAPETRQVLKTCIALFVQIDTNLEKKPSAAVTAIAQLDRLTKYLAHYSPKEYQELYEIRIGIERRVKLFHRVCMAVNELGPDIRLKPRTLADYERFVAKTQAVENYFGKLRSKAAADWRGFLYLEEIEDVFDRCAARMEHLADEEQIPMTELHEICTIASIILECFSRELSPEQTRFMAQPILQAWKSELAFWNDNLVHPLRFLAVLERYESQELTSDSVLLADYIYRLTLSENQHLKTLGHTARKIYEGPNVRFYLSGVLVNHFIPDREPEFDRVREVVAGTPVVGKRRTDTILNVQLEPDPQQLRMNLQVTGTVDALSDAQSRKVLLRSQTKASYFGEKPLQWTAEGIASGPVEVDVSNNTRLRSIRTRVDGVPLLSEFVKDIARGQYAKQEGQVHLETWAKITHTVRERIDGETKEHLSLFNARYNELSQKFLERNGMYLDQKGASTTEDWLLSSWYLGSHGALGSHTFEPDTPQGAFADLKIHESAFRTALRSLELEGKTFTLQELQELITKKTGFTDFAEDGEHAELLIAFAEKNPIQVHFTEGCVRIHLAMQAMKFRRSVWRDFEFIVLYRPSVDEAGNLCLKREREPWVICSKNARSQFALRTFVTRLCPANKPFSLVPDFIMNDPRFERLTVAEPRIEQGWCAIAIVEKPEPVLSFEALEEPARTTKVRARNVIGR